MPPEPIIFMKATSAICGPNDPVIIPRGSQKTDWEVELGVVIGKRAKYVTEADALDHVAGYCLVNDVSERAFQTERQGQWTKGKSADHFGPTGPWLVTRDEVADPQKLTMWLKVNGADAPGRHRPRTMVYGVRFLVAYLSQFMSLDPGDIVSTGTPPGVGMGHEAADLPQGRRRDRARHRGPRASSARSASTTRNSDAAAPRHPPAPDLPRTALDYGWTAGAAGARGPRLHAGGLPGG